MGMPHTIGEKKKKRKNNENDAEVHPQNEQNAGEMPAGPSVSISPWEDDEIATVRYLLKKGKGVRAIAAIIARTQEDVSILSATLLGERRSVPYAGVKFNKKHIATIKSLVSKPPFLDTPFTFREFVEVCDGITPTAIRASLHALKEEGILTITPNPQRKSRIVYSVLPSLITAQNEVKHHARAARMGLPTTLTTSPAMVVRDLESISADTLNEIRVLSSTSSDIAGQMQGLSDRMEIVAAGIASLTDVQRETLSLFHTLADASQRKGI